LIALPGSVRESPWRARLEAAVQATVSAGAALQQLRSYGITGAEGGGGQLKTSADEAAEGWVLGYLRARFPGDAFLAEEEFERTDGAWTPPAAFWTVDALDGTRSFVDGFPGFCVQVAYVHDGAVRLGVVYEPATGACYLGVEGAGAYRASAGGECVRLRVDAAPARPVFVDSTRPGGLPGAWFSLHDAEFLECGSIGIKICRVAEGSAHVFLKSLRYKLWDVAPGELILAEAGGRLGLWTGGRIDYRSGQVLFDGLLAAPAELFGGVVDDLARLADAAG
jgi:fructose-1,6-bisphosphatase/inositol monophosphatase family enzyme